MPYAERRTAVPGVLLWTTVTGPDAAPTRILPDGCLDLIWDGRRAVVAGPDTAARLHQPTSNERYVALRFAAGTGPALLGESAQALLDKTIELDQVLPSRSVRELTADLHTDPVGAVERWLVRRAGQIRLDPFGARVLQLTGRGRPVSAIAGALGLSERQLQRRSLAHFGYGPKMLARVVRLNRAVAAARSGAAWADVAAGCGYADQAHLAREVRALTGTTPTRLLLELAGR